MPLYSYACRGCGAKLDRLRSVEDRNKEFVCSLCGGTAYRDVSQELPNMLGTEKKFTPYFDVGVGKQINTRAEQQAEWKARGLVGLSRRELKDQIDRGMRNPVKPYNDKAQKEAWSRACIRGARRVYETRRITITT